MMAPAEHIQHVAPMLTKADLAVRLRLTPRSIERRMRSGDCPPFFRRGKQALWNPIAVDQWVDRNTFTSLAHERAAEVHRKRGEQKGNSVTACLLADLAGIGGRSS